MLPFEEVVVYGGIQYRTPENFYQAMKFDDLDERRYVASLNPYKAKRYARGKAPEWWGEVKLGIMEFALREKFARGTAWYEKLMATGDEPIIEWNNWGDVYWGIDVRYGIGKNYLGELLMKIRKEFQDENLERHRGNKKKTKRRLDTPVQKRRVR